MRWMVTVLAASLVMAGGAYADAKPPLREVKEIDDNLLWVGIAHEISKKCDEIDARTLKGLTYLNSLRRKAREMGYTHQEIEEYHSSKAEKARVRAKGEAYVKSKGLDPENAEDLCALGHAEIARNSTIGIFLKAK